MTYNILDIQTDVHHNERGVNTGMTLVHFWGRNGWTLDQRMAIVYGSQDQAIAELSALKGRWPSMFDGDETVRKAVR